MKKRDIVLTKIEELPEAKHSKNKEVGYIRVGKFIETPVIGKPFYVGSGWRTSKVTEIIDENTFKTLNSIYKFKMI